MKNQFNFKATLGNALFGIVLCSSPLAMAHDKEAHAKPKPDAPISAEEHVFGKQGNPKAITRTIAIDMTDMMRFTPQDITVKQGETIRFAVTNKGKLIHEMVIGTLEELKKHGEMMKKHPGMEHDEPFMSHVSPGKKEDLVWQFTKTGEFHYACLLPGHFEAGMVGKITVIKA
ncbi:MAG: cupredoxin family protein [Pseudomonadota bacterium]